MDTELGRDAIARRVPHAGNMCLLDKVTHWNDESITALAHNLHNADNPLLRDAKLPATALLEYAAQAAAVHAGLAGTGMGGARAAYIGAVRNMVLHVREVSGAYAHITCTARALLANPEGAIYQLEVDDPNGRRLLDARVTLVLPG